MNVIAFYVMKNENVSREIAEKTAELFFEGMSYEEAFEKAKEILKDTNKNYKCNKLEKTLNYIGN